MLQKTVMTYQNGQEGFRSVCDGLAEVKVGDIFVTTATVMNKQEQDTPKRSVDVRGTVVEVVNKLEYNDQQVQIRFVTLEIDSESAQKIYKAHQEIAEEIEAESNKGDGENGQGPAAPAPAPAPAPMPPVNTPGPVVKR